MARKAVMDTKIFNRSLRNLYSYYVQERGKLSELTRKNDQLAPRNVLLKAVQSMLSFAYMFGDDDWYTKRMVEFIQQHFKLDPMNPIVFNHIRKELGDDIFELVKMHREMDEARKSGALNEDNILEEAEKYVQDGRHGDS